eukprot:SM000245S08199  [mRNA]  locus=s245:75844:76122:+ [translate_table: standard]
MATCLVWLWRNGRAIFRPGEPRDRALKTLNVVGFAVGFLGLPFSIVPVFQNCLSNKRQVDDMLHMCIANMPTYKDFPEPKCRTGFGIAGLVLS